MSENLNPIVLEVEEVRVVNAVSPTVDVQRIENGAEVTIHDYRGTQTVEIYDGEKGDAYILTQADKEEIAGIAEDSFTAEVKQWHDTVVQKAGQVSTDKGIVEGYMERSETAATSADSSASAAHTSEVNAATSATAAENSATAAHNSEVNAASSATAAGASATAASGSETAAAQSATNAASSASAASGSATAAHTSEVNAAASATAASASATAAGTSENNAAGSATAAAGSATSASQSATAAQAVLDSIPEDYSALSSDVTDLKSAITLQEETIPGTTQTITFDSDGNVQRITHMADSTVVRTDVFTFAASTITEVRTLASGESLTIVTNTETLETTTTYAAA